MILSLSKKIGLLSFIVFVLLLASSGFASMTGGVYKIESDSINSGGNDNSSYGNYRLDDTIGESAIGLATSSNFSLGAGYRQMDESGLAIGLSIQNLVLTPDLGGITGGVSVGLAEVLITTDNPAGYYLSLKSEMTPAMQSAEDTIADYIPVDAVPDYELIVSPGQSIFAFTPEGVDVVDRYRDDGESICGVTSGNNTISRCWDGLTVIAKSVAYRGFKTSLDGVSTTLRFSAGIGANRMQKNGSYFATTTITALPL